MAAIPKMTSEAAASKYNLSKRGAENFVDGDHWVPFEKALENAWDKEKNPNGIVNLGLAENSLMHEEVSSYFKEHSTINPETHLTYGIGPRGSPRLRTALSSFFSTHFHSLHPVKPEQILPISGVSALTDALTWCICGDGEGILIPQPLYTGFQEDIMIRARGRIVTVGFKDIEGYEEKGLDAVFDSDMNEKALEKALKKSTEKGVAVRAVLITNPHNPLGKCYPPSTLKTIATFCSNHNLHLILDEIYAYSVFQNPAAPSAVPFTSILSLDLSGIIDANLVHVMYGMSKDFCANGARLGVLVSRNEGLIGAMASLSVFAWPPYMIQDVWASMLEDRSFLDSFLAENKKRLAENYILATSFLDEHGIKYFKGGNAGVFIWTDFRPYFSSELKITKLERESQVLSTCSDKNVFIGYGSNFFTEEVGWFRITFTCPREALTEGLERIMKSLEAMGGSN